MKRLVTVSAVLLLAALLLLPDAIAQDPEAVTERRKLAQTGMKFLSVSIDARSAAMADAMTAMEGTSVSMFYNPAGMASMTSSFHASAGQVRWIADIDYNIASIAYRPGNGGYGVVGLFVTSVDYGTIRRTIRADTPSGYIDMGEYSPTALSVGVGYANAITDRFSVGANVKYVRESIGEAIMSVGDGGSANTQDFAESALAYDFGILYRTGFRSLNFAMSVRNFAQEVRYATESFELPLTFSIGMSMDMLDVAEVGSPDMHAFILSVDAERPRDYYEQVKIGGEYSFMNTFALRAGYTYPTDFQGINLGVGLRSSVGGVGFGFDYAYSEFGIVGNVNRLGLQLSF